MEEKDLKFTSVEDFVDYVVDRVVKDDGLFLTVIAKFNNMKDIFKEIMSYDNLQFENIQLESPLIGDYDDEFVLSLWANHDDDIELGCEKLKIDGEYTNPCGDEVYLFDDCSSKIISLCGDSCLYYVNTTDDCDDNDSGSDCNDSRCCDLCEYKSRYLVEDCEEAFRKLTKDFDKMFFICR